MPLSQEINLDYDRWKNMPEDSTRFYEYNHSRQDRDNRQSIVCEIMPTINRIIYSHLTPRQSQVMSLYRRELTQINIAKILGISQPTVSQHLNGKRRNGKKIGGSFRRIRKKIHEYARKENWTHKDKSILLVLDMLLDKNITRRRATIILDRIAKNTFGSSC